MFHIMQAGLVVLTWSGALFRYRALFANRFHADEALFASWARHIAVWRDPLLLTQAVDKPPLLFYLQALPYPLFGPVEWAARLPNLAASLLLIPLVGILAYRLYRQKVVALGAAAFVALAPLAIQFSATVFTDPLLTFWLIAALFFAAPHSSSLKEPDSRALLLSGLFFGLAVFTKHQAWLFLPLVGAFAWLARWPRRGLVRWLGGFLIVMFVLGLWLLAREQSINLWAAQLANAGGLRAAWSWEVVPRLMASARLVLLSLGWPLAVAAIVGLIPLCLSALRGQTIQNRLDAVLLSFVIAYLAFHSLTAVPIWDRYLLPVLPLMLILTARGLGIVSAGILAAAQPPVRRSNLLRYGTSAALAVILFAAVWAAFPAREGRLPVGGQPAADQGAGVTAELLADAPYGTVLYDHWYSWHWRYQLFDSRVYVNWVPHPTALVDDLDAFAATPGDRYLVLPDGPQALPFLNRLSSAGYRLEPVLPEHRLIESEAIQMRLYRIIPEAGDGA